MGRVQDKVALVTGAARGQGRAHAIRLAEEGAHVIAVDICADIEGVPYPLATAGDLEQTVKEVEALDRQAVGIHADVRDFAAMEAAVAEGSAEIGPIDIVVANAGIGTFARVWELTPEAWRQMIDTNLSGQFYTVRAALPAMRERGRGGSLVMVSSAAGLAAFPNLAHYTAAKHGVTGLTRALAIELAADGIRANSVHPTTVDTPMVQNEAFWGLAGAASREDAARIFPGLNALPIPWVDPVDVSNAVLWLASDEARYVTGVALPVDAGGSQPWKIPNLPPA